MQPLSITALLGFIINPLLLHIYEHLIIGSVLFVLLIFYHFVLNQKKLNDIKREVKLVEKTFSSETNGAFQINSLFLKAHNLRQYSFKLISFSY